MNASAPSPAPDLGRAALDYAERGWLVIPLHTPTARGCSCGRAECENSGKHPRTAHGLKDASREPAVIRAWWERWPNSNIGILTGPESGILVLDVDGKQGEESLIELQRHYGPLPDTFTVQTGGGGQHIYFLWPEGADVRNSASKIAPGLDIRGQGGYVVAPPSLHASGRRYEVNESAIPPVPCPERLLSCIQEPPATQTRQSAPAAGAMASPAIPKGNRTKHLVSLAGTMHKRGMAPDAIEAALLAENMAKCSPPLAREKVRSLAHDIPVRYPNPIDHTATLNPMTAKNDWRHLFHTYDELVNAPPLRFAIEGFTQEQGIGLIGALAGHGKTLLMLAMVESMLTGRALFGHFEVKSPSKRVLYLIPECSIGPFWARLKLFRLDEQVRADRLLVSTLSAKEQVSLVDPRILKAAEGADIFLDTAVRFMGGTENEVEPARIFAQTLFNLLAAGARTITGAHHAPKGFETQERMTLENILRGSGDLGAMLSTAWGLRQIDADTNRIYIENVKARDFQPCQSYIIEGRPHLDDTGHFKMTTKPGEAGELRDHLADRGTGRPADPARDEKTRQALELREKGKSYEQIGKTLGVSKGTVSKWLQKHDEQFPNRFHGNGNEETQNPAGENEPTDSSPLSGRSLGPFPNSNARGVGNGNEGERARI